METILVAEIEYWLLRTEEIPPEDALTVVNNRYPKIHEQ